VGDGNVQFERNGWGAIFVVREGLYGCPPVGEKPFRQIRSYPVEMLRSGWWSGNTLKHADAPIPFRSIRLSKRYNQLQQALEPQLSSLIVTQSRNLSSGVTSESLRHTRHELHASFELLCSISRIRPNETSGMMVFTGEVQKFQTDYGMQPLPHGRGRWSTLQNVTLQQGTFREGWLYQHGEHIYTDNSHIDADNFLNGIPVGLGHGRWVWSSGPSQTYVGGLNGTRLHGLGVLRARNGDYFQGEFHNDLKDGAWGIQYRHSKTRGLGRESLYRGSWRKGRRSGVGLLRRADGSEYLGEWHHDRPHGVGRRTEKDGVVFDGQWRRGQLSGFGVQLDSMGTVIRCGSWRGGSLKEDGPVPLRFLSRTMQATLPATAALVDKSPFATSLVYYVGQTDSNDEKPHGRGRWMLETDVGFSHVIESTSLEAPACKHLLQSTLTAGQYHFGMLRGRGVRWYPNGDHVCGQFVEDRGQAYPHGAGVLYTNETKQYHLGQFNYGNFSVPGSTGIGYVWQESHCYRIHHRLASEDARPPRRKLPIFAQDPDSGHIHQRTTTAMMEGHMWQKENPVAFEVWWNTTSGHLMSSQTDFLQNSSVVPTVPAAMMDTTVRIGPAVWTITVNTSSLYNSNNTMPGTITSTTSRRAIVSTPIPTSLLWNISFLSPAAATSALLRPPGPWVNCSYLYYKGQLNDELVAPAGRGAWYCSDDEIVERGRYLNGNLHGLGMRIFPNGDRWEGFFGDGQAHGNGRMRFIHGDIYTGTYVQGKRGRNANRNSQISEWRESRSGTICEGDWHEDLPSGLWSCAYLNGTRWSGYFVAGKRNGPGALWDHKGFISHIGLWSDDHPVNAADIGGAGNWIPARLIPKAVAPWSRMEAFSSGMKTPVALFAKSEKNPLNFRVYCGKITSTVRTVEDVEMVWDSPGGFGKWIEQDGTTTEDGFFWNGALRFGTRTQWDESQLHGFFLPGGCCCPWLLGVCLIFVLLGAIIACFRWFVLTAQWLDSRYEFSASLRDRWQVWKYGSLPLAAYLGKRSIRGFINLGDRQLLFRTLRMNEVEAIKGHGCIRASDPNANRSPEEHVRDGSKAGFTSQWISTTSSIDVARKWMGLFGQLAIVRHSASSNAIDISTSASREQHLVDEVGIVTVREHTHAERAREVLFCRSIEAHDVALCAVRTCKVEQIWPPPNDFLDGPIGDELERALCILRSRDEQFPVPDPNGFLNMSPENWIVHGPKGRLLHVEHRSTGRHYLSHGGVANLHWTTSYGQGLATSMQLLLQCQTDVIVQLMYRVLYQEIDQHRSTFPPCALYLCKITHEVITNQDLDAAGGRSSLLIPDGEAVPVLLYLMPSDSVPLIGSLESHAQAELDPVGHLKDSFWTTLFLDALLLVSHIDDSSVFWSAPDPARFVEDRSKLLRYGHVHCLDKRPDDEHSSIVQERLVIPMLKSLLERHPHLYDRCHDTERTLQQLGDFLDLLRQRGRTLLWLLGLLQNCRMAESNFHEASIRAEGRRLLRRSVQPMDVVKHWEEGTMHLQTLHQVWGTNPVLSIREALQRAEVTLCEPPLYEDSEHHVDGPADEEQEQKG
jgi:hypothetical protein